MYSYFHDYKSENEMHNYKVGSKVVFHLVFLGLLFGLCDLLSQHWQSDFQCPVDPKTADSVL